MAMGRKARLRGRFAALAAPALALCCAAPAAPSSAQPRPVKSASAKSAPAPTAAPSPPAAAPSSSASAAPSSSASAAPSSSASAAPAASASASATAPPKDKRERQARAVELHNEAKSLYERGLYRRAIAKLEAALELDPEGRELLYNLALIHEKLAEVDVAERYYLRYIEMETDPKARERAQAIVKRLQGAKQKIKADIEERAAASASVSAGPSALLTASAAAPVASGPRRRMPSPMVFVIGGVAVAALGVGVGLGVSALTTYPSGMGTGPGVTSYDLETRARSAHTQAVIADLSFVSALAIGTGAALLYLLESRSPPAAPAAAPLSSARPAAGVPF